MKTEINLDTDIVNMKKNVITILEGIMKFGLKPELSKIAKHSKKSISSLHSSWKWVLNNFDIDLKISFKYKGKLKKFKYK